MTEKKTTVTRAEKKDGAKKLILEILRSGNKKSNEIIDEASKVYAEKFGGEDTENPNDVRGRIGSVLDVMKKEGEVTFDGGMYALKAETTLVEREEKPKKATRAKGTKKKDTAEEGVKEKPQKTKKTVKAKKTEEQPQEQTEEVVQPLPPAPVLPIAPVAPITPEVAPEPIPEDKPKKTVKSRAKKEKAVTEKTTVSETEETEKGLKEVAPIEEEKKEEEKKQEEKAEVKTVQEISPKGTLMDMSFLLKEVKPVLQKSLPAPVPAPLPVPLVKAQEEEKTADTKPSAKAEQKTQKKPQSKKTERVSAQKPVRQQTAEERLQEAFLTRLRKLGGAYFEYYSVYLLERYARRNGRRLEGLKITGGEHDGGIDGEIELTDRLGFRETIYIQAKNWNPDKGDEKYWVVGETLLQQFIGACVCRQSKDKKQHCRGIFITTSRFTPEAQRILADTSDKFVGYDGADLFEVAQECEFGLIRKNGVWVLDEELLSGEKAFFRAF